MSTPVLPDFTRWQWASTVDKQWYAPQFTKASRIFTHLERLTVAAGVRKAAWQFVSYSELVSLTAWAQQHDLRVVPMQQTSISGQYSSSGHSGNLNAYRVVVCHKDHYNEVFPFESNQRIGTLLGYPECCRKSFDETWGQGQVDNTYEQFQNMKGNETNGGKHSIYASTMLRWMGVRLVPHLPCAFNCAASIRFGEDLARVGREHGYVEEIQFMEEVLNWPMHWNRMFGIAEIITPALRITTRSDWTPKKQEFTLSGKFTRPTKELWTQNGYSDPSAMMESHDALIAVLRDKVPQGGRIVDLGCGNGLLLKRLKLHRPDITICGVDINEDAIKAADMEYFHPGYIEDGAWSMWNVDVALITPGRLLEMHPEDADNVRNWLSKIPTVCVYSYADWKEPLENLVNETKLGTVDMLTKLPGVSIGILTGITS